MNEVQAPGSTPLSIHTEHGPLHGQLTLPPGAGGLIILAHAASDATQPVAAQDIALAARLQPQRFGTLTLDLMPQAETRFNDLQNNVALLAKRLLAGLDLIKRQMQNGALPALPIGLCAADHVSPVIVRIAAQRDQDIAAVVCRSGLIDRAGMLYLRALSAPLLVLMGEIAVLDEPAGSAAIRLASNQRALQEVSCRKALKRIPDTDDSFALPIAFDKVAAEVSQWFEQYCRQENN